MTNNYQTRAARTSAGPRHAVPETVSVAMAEIAEDMREGLLALAVGAGLQVMQTLMGEDVTAVCGPKGRHDPGQITTRHGHEAESVSLGGRRVPVARPRMRGTDGGGELPVPAYKLFSQTEVLGPDGDAAHAGRVVQPPLPRRLGAGRAACRGRRHLDEQVGDQPPVRAATETAPVDLLAAPLAGPDLVALMIDGVHFGDHLCVVALGIGIDGVKHPLALVEGSTENTAIVTELLVGLRERGLDTTGPILVGIDGAKALRAAVVRVFDHPVIQRCQLHKLRNVADKLPDHLAATVSKQMRAAYHAESALAAEAQLEALARELQRTHRGAAASLCEGMTETLSVLRLGVGPTLARTLRSTNSIESMRSIWQSRLPSVLRPPISIARAHSRNVTNWQNGQMALRWCAAGMIEAGKQFRRVNGHLHLPALRTALDRHVAAGTVGAAGHNEPVIAA